MRDYEHAAVRVPRGDPTHRVHDARFELFPRLGVSPRSRARLREPIDDLLIRQSLPRTEVAFAKFRQSLDLQSESIRNEPCRVVCSGEVARIDGVDRFVGKLLCECLGLGNAGRSQWPV